MQAIFDYFDRHEEQAFIAKAFLTIFLIIIAKSFFSGLLALLFLLFPVIFFFYIRMQAAATGGSAYELLKEHITFIPLLRTEGDRKTEVIPWVTYGIVLLNILIFYGYEANVWTDPKFIGNNLVFLPRTPNAWNVVVSTFSSLFLHASGGHLWGNMVFLWMLGTAVERRIGPERFALLYFITGLCGSIVFVLSWLVATGEPGHVLGASGAIAGIMGIFAVRCYFKSMIFPLPILGIFSLILPISLKVRLNSLVIIGLFFLADLSGGIGQVTGHSTSMVGHWAHLGGMISGIVLATFLKLGEGAVEERHLEIGVKAAGMAVGYSGGEPSLRLVLERNPDNVEALLALARLKSKYATSEEGGELFARTIALMAGSRVKETTAVFEEYFKIYQKPLAPEVMFSLAGLYRGQGDFDTAARCLEAVIAAPDAPADLRQKALGQGAAILEKLGFAEVAKGYYETLIKEFPHSEMASRAYAQLGRPQPPPAPSPTTEAAACGAAPGHDAMVCPACKSAMQKRRASNGAHAGKLFWVCAGYPQCKGLVPVGEG